VTSLAHLVPFYFADVGRTHPRMSPEGQALSRRMIHSYTQIGQGRKRPLHRGGEPFREPIEGDPVYTTDGDQLWRSSTTSSSVQAFKRSSAEMIFSESSAALPIHWRITCGLLLDRQDQHSLHLNLLRIPSHISDHCTRDKGNPQNFDLSISFPPLHFPFAYHITTNQALLKPSDTTAALDFSDAWACLTSPASQMAALSVPF
jgi:hypothetical protein